eukprot:TRINITY_DN2357_c4_g1_i1.p1 TRINITY_DN2357_c4_g1~~TRINITY_DN2357_c4_g1_i1.p1  ORF type:complete len:175 (+),score=48.00 TRINITY_DN2357_c4_g1_i1:70-594(+)
MGPRPQRPLRCLLLLLLLLESVQRSCLAFYVESPLSLSGARHFSVATFGPPYVVREMLLVELQFAQPPDGCSVLNNPSQVAGAACLLLRGGCSFADKALACQRAGGVAAVIVNSEGTHGKQGLFMMSDDGGGTKVTIRSVLIGHSDGMALLNVLARGQPVTVGIGHPIGVPLGA